MEVSNINNPINSLSLTYKQLVELRVGKKECKSLTEPELKRECVSIITRSFTYSTPNGQTDASIIQHQSIELYNAIKSGYSTLTVAEIQQAFKQGLDGVYGQYFGMCGKTYTQFLKGFFNNPERSKAWLEYLNKTNEVKTAETPQHIKLDITKNGLLNRFERFKKDGNLGFAPWRAYDALKDVLKVKSLVNRETFLKVKSELEPRWTDTLKMEKLKAERSGSHGQAEDFATLLANGIENYPPFQSAMKERLLKEYFKSIDKLEI